jgi:hypothetical protein
MAIDRKNQKLTYQSGDRSTMNYDIHDSKKFYINTTAKAASSWCAEKFGESEPLQFHISTMKLNDQFNDNPSELVSNVLKDWDSLLKGKSCKKDFIFLIRNPLEKLVTGFIQDVLLKELHNDSVSSLLFQEFVIGLGYSKYETEQFCQYYNWQYHAKDREGYVENFPDVDIFGKDDIFLPMYYHIMETMVDHWANDLPRFINQFNTNHKQSNLIFILKLLNFPPEKMDTSKIRIIDLNRQNLGNTLKSLYGIKLDSDKVHARTSKFKHLIYLAFKKHLPLINTVLSTELTIYSEIINKIYPHEMYASKNKKNMLDYIYSDEEFLNEEEIPLESGNQKFIEPLDYKILQRQFILKTNKIQTKLRQITKSIKDEGDGSLESVLKEMEKRKESDNASSLVSQYLV